MNALYDTVEITEYVSPNAGKYGPEKTLYLDTFHPAQVQINLVFISIFIMFMTLSLF